ncbi:hypothetical protein [Actinoplanes sp. G11-F43]|uniref:hypothetical protein n=1 Tax=Actinoplanes sp. G11-F43 TaxID=3424130 RepID=UPI003D34E72F
MSLLLFYVVLLGLSALALLLVAVTGFGAAEVEDRIFSGVGALAAGAYAFYLMFQFQGGTYFFFYGALFLPAYTAYRLFKGFRDREQNRADRQTMKAKEQAAGEWRSARRW